MCRQASRATAPVHAGISLPTSCRAIRRTRFPQSDEAKPERLARADKYLLRGIRFRLPEFPTLLGGTVVRHAGRADAGGRHRLAGVRPDPPPARPRPGRVGAISSSTRFGPADRPRCRPLRPPQGHDGLHRGRSGVRPAVSGVHAARGWNDRISVRRTGGVRHGSCVRVPGFDCTAAQPRPHAAVPQRRGVEFVVLAVGDDRRTCGRRRVVC